MNEPNATMAVLPPQCSVELTVSTKGVVTWTIKAYANNTGDARQMVLDTHERLLTQFGDPGKSGK